MVEDIAKTVWNPKLVSLFKDPGVPARKCPKSFKAVSKKGNFYLKYRVIVQCILNSGWIPANTEDMGVAYVLVESSA